MTGDKPMPASGAKWVYRFGRGAAEGKGEMRNLLGGKGAGLAEMANLGLPVPPGFTITTEVCTYFYAHDESYPPDLKEQVAAALAEVEEAIGAKFGDPKKPLLVSVRSGARASMPGMMDTVLNLGLNDDTVEGLARESGDERFAYDSYRRFLQMYGQVVLGIDHHHFEELIENHKNETGMVLDTELTAEDWKSLASGLKEVVQDETGKPFPQDAHEQLWGAIAAVFGSWNNARAVTYRRLHNIPAEWGTAVNVQAMVFGNRGEDCATGGAFTRHPHPAAPDPGRKEGFGIEPAGDGRGDAPGVRRVAEGPPYPRRPVARYAGHRVHRRARPALDAADPYRQAHRSGRTENRGVVGRGGGDRPRRGDPPHRPQLAGSAAAPNPRSLGQNRRSRAWPASLAWRRFG